MKQWLRYLLFLFLLSLPVMACSFVTDALTSSNPPTTESSPGLPAIQKDSIDDPTLPDIEDPMLTQGGDAPPVDGSLPAETGRNEPAPVQDAGAAPDWPGSIAPFVPFARTAVTADEEATFALLNGARLPERDDIELARLYEGWDGLLPPVEPIDGPLPVGTIEQLNVLNHSSITIDPIKAELLAVSDHAYFWFDTGPGSFRPSQEKLAQVGQEFDRIYEESVALFGSENNPGVDGDPRIHLVNAAPGALCDPSQTCSIAGYFSAADGIPVAVDPESNAREMFVMEMNNFGSEFYLNVLTHELRHMIEENYDSGDADWEAEGAATLAEDLLGYQDEAIFRANLFLLQPDQQLNSWTDVNRSPHYGQGYLLNRYIYDRLGRDIYAQFGASPEYGLQAIDAIAQINNLDLTGEQLWLEWLVALALHNHRESPEMYRFGVTGLDSAAMTVVDGLPAAFAETVQQYAADYYYLDGNDDVSLNFSGSALAPVMHTVPASGQWMWAANRANYSHASLTRPVDLTGVDGATLSYQVYHDIEAGYDFAYLFISEDDGQTWQPLVAQNMAGTDEDPAESALADHFYTGRSEQWLAEQVDLTPYAGQEILIRFAYVTDPILTLGGIAIDNIAIPEIDFFDDVETLNAGWTSLGFERVTAAIPQQWHLQLITFLDGIPQVESLPLSSEQTVSRRVALLTSGGEAILIVAASAPMTLEPAYYRLDFGQ